MRLSRIVIRVVLSQKGIFYFLITSKHFVKSSVLKFILSIILFPSLFDLTWTDLEPWKEVLIFGIFKTYLLAPLALWLCCSLKGLNKSSNIAGRLLFRWSKTSMQLFKVIILARLNIFASVYRDALGCLSSLKVIILRALFWALWTMTSMSLLLCPQTWHA